MKKVCVVCQWWKVMDVVAGLGYCHYNPPVVVMFSHDDVQGVWPTTWSDDFCHCWDLRDGLSYDEI